MTFVQNEFLYKKKEKVSVSSPFCKYSLIFQGKEEELFDLFGVLSFIEYPNL